MCVSYWEILEVLRNYAGHLTPYTNSIAATYVICLCTGRITIIYGRQLNKLALAQIHTHTYTLIGYGGARRLQSPTTYHSTNTQREVAKTTNPNE